MRQFGAGKCSNTPASQKVCACDNNNFFRRLKYTDDVTVFPSHADSGYEESKTEINRRNMAMTVEEEGKWISLSTVDAWDVKIKNTSDDSGLNQSRPPTRAILPAHLPTDPLVCRVVTQVVPSRRLRMRITIFSDSLTSIQPLTAPMHHSLKPDGRLPPPPHLSPVFSFRGVV